MGNDTEVRILYLRTRVASTFVSTSCRKCMMHIVHAKRSSHLFKVYSTGLAWDGRYMYSAVGTNRPDLRDLALFINAGKQVAQFVNVSLQPIFVRGSCTQSTTTTKDYWPER